MGSSDNLFLGAPNIGAILPKPAPQVVSTRPTTQVRPTPIKPAATTTRGGTSGVRQATSTRSAGGSGGGGVPGSSLLLQLAQNPYDRALQQALADYNKGKNDTVTGGRRAQADLGELFSRLDAYTRGLLTEGAKANRQTSYRTNANYNDLLRAVEGSYRQGAGGTTNELKRLGIDAVAPAALSGIAKDASHQTSQVKIDKVNANTNNANQAQLFNSMMREILASGQTEGTSQKGRAGQATRDALSNLLAEYTKQKGNLQGAKADALLKARLQIQQEQAAARERALSRAAAAARSAGGGGASSAKTPRGLIAGISYLQQYAGGNQKLFNDLKGAFESGVNLEWDDKNHHDAKGNLLRYDKNLDNLPTHWQNFTVRNHGWTQAELRALTTALAAYNGKL